MADSEKLTALKKAYADIILNTAKEAASRVMSSEKKAERYQRELVAAKDEGVRLLLRLKKILDFKVSEAEKTFLHQQKKIEVLEAQLGEAEDIVKDLRIELQELRAELKKVKKSRAQDVKEIPKDAIATRVTISEENRLNASDAVVSPLPADKSHSVIASEIRNPTFSVKVDDDKSCTGSGCFKDNCFACSPDFASIVMRSKEHELYRNGCTQRIRAFEQNQLGGSPHSVKSHSITSQICTNDDQVDECTKRKRDTGCKRYKPTCFNDLKARVGGKYVKSGQDSRINEDFIEGITDHVESKPFSETTERTVPAKTTSGNTGCMRDCTVQSFTNNEKSIADGLGAGRVIGSADTLDFPPTKRATVVAGVQRVNSDQKESVTTEVCSTQPVNNKLIKFTFQRKRKRDCPSNPDVVSSPETSTLKMRKVEKQSDTMEPERSDLIIEPSRDDRSLEEIAHQLLFLSEQKGR